MCKHGTTVPMPIRGRVVDVDACIASIVATLNAGGLITKASCCGHGNRPGSIVLDDGRELFVLKDFKAARAADRLFPRDIHGNERIGSREMRAFHLNLDGYARAFIRINGLRERMVLWLRGWRPHSLGGCWQKPNRKQRLLERS